ncbi:PREDICTED: protein MKS1-like [Ipomoea nil]|uniref:protein MKS1-like n=1 Tax=Ipomoea nil TaxID=35883 RepID=UPI0009009834|nr:PREDICTED: protein MKS1-like [Ipomoea nil]
MNIVPVAGKSPRRELQGPRPTPLKVRKDSQKIRKPPVAAPPQQPPATAPPRPPLIIYTVSPKVIHANPNEFMTLVQRLTGPDSSSMAVQPSTFDAFHGGFDDGAVSPAARFASVEKTRSTQVRKPDLGMVQGIELSSDTERSGVLSPNPASLPPIPASIFSSPSGQNPVGYFPDLSPVFHSNKIYDGLETSFMLPSPSATFISPRIIISPGTPSLDLFNNLFDL